MATTLIFGPITIPDGYKVVLEGRTLIASPEWPEMKTDVRGFFQGILASENALEPEKVLPAKPAKKLMTAATRKKLAAASKKRWKQVAAAKALEAKALKGAKKAA